MFKCRWFDTNPNRSGSVKIDNGLLSVNINRTWYDDDPYILANMATQIVYLDDPKAGNGWKVVQKMDHRNVYAIPELDPTDNDVDNVADQRFESSMENDAETLRDTNVIQEPFQIQGVSSIEIPIQSITIDLGDLPRYDVAVGLRNDDDVVIEEEEEEEDWETENLIRRRRSVTSTLSSEASPQPTSAATAPAQMLQLVGGPVGSQTPASSASSVAQPVSARRRHRPVSTTDTTSTEVNTRGPCRQLKMAKVTRVTNSRINIGYDERHRAAPTPELHSSLAHDVGHTNYNLEGLDDDSSAYLNRLFSDRYKQWKSDLHHYFAAFEDPEVALQEGCPKELEGREDSWAWLCAHFQAPDFVPKSIRAIGRRRLFSTIHVIGPSPIGLIFNMGGGSKFPEIDVFGDVYVRPGNELAESLHTTMVERSQLVLQQSASQLPPETPIESVDPPQDAGFQILTETLDQTLGRRPGTYCRGMGNARQREPRPRPAAQSSQVTALTVQVATLQSQMSVILESLARSGIPIPQFHTATSEPVQPEHPQQTTAPAQTSEQHVPDDNVDFGTLFD
ncbi:unnamed protein product [Prunus brigantina]